MSSKLMQKVRQAFSGINFRKGSGLEIRIIPDYNEIQIRKYGKIQEKAEFISTENVADKFPPTQELFHTSLAEINPTRKNRALRHEEPVMGYIPFIGEKPENSTEIYGKMYDLYPRLFGGVEVWSAVNSLGECKFLISKTSNRIICFFLDGEEIFQKGGLFPETWDAEMTKKINPDSL